MIKVPLKNPRAPATWWASVRRSFVRHSNDPDIPDELRLELLRAGFIELAGAGSTQSQEWYIHGDRIAEVSGDIVRLYPAVQA